MTTRSWSSLASMHLFSLAVQRVAHIHHPEVHEIVPSHHCVVRFRQRRPVRARGADAVAEALVAVLESADVSRWPPGWAVSDRHTDLWAVNGELAFPLERTDRLGRYVATTCLTRGEGEWVRAPVATTGAGRGDPVGSSARVELRGPQNPPATGAARG